MKAVNRRVRPSSAGLLEMRATARSDRFSSEGIWQTEAAGSTRDGEAIAMWAAAVFCRLAIFSVALPSWSATSTEEGSAWHWLRIAGQKSAKGPEEIPHHPGGLSDRRGPQYHLIPAIGGTGRERGIGHPKRGTVDRDEQSGFERHLLFLSFPSRGVEFTERHPSRQRVGNVSFPFTGRQGVYRGGRGKRKYELDQGTPSISRPM